MRIASLVASLVLPAALACASGAGGPPPSASQADSAIEQATPPCMGNTDGDCPSGDPMQDF